MKESRVWGQATNDEILENLTDDIINKHSDAWFIIFHEAVLITMPRIRILCIISMIIPIKS